MMPKTMMLTTSPTKPMPGRWHYAHGESRAGLQAGPEAGVSHVRETGLSWTIDQTVPDRAVLIFENESSSCTDQ
jgi:hypothetical protein